MVTSRQALPLFDHRTRDVKRVDVRDALGQMARQEAGAAAGVEDAARTIDNKIAENIEDGRRIRRAMPVGPGDGSILKGAGNLSAEEVGFRLHCGPSLS